MAFIDTKKNQNWHWSLDDVNTSKRRKALI
jgi:hypothetical protein